MCVFVALQEIADGNDGKAVLIDGSTGTNGVQSDASGNDQTDQVTDNRFSVSLNCYAWSNNGAFRPNLFTACKTFDI